MIFECRIDKHKESLKFEFNYHRDKFGKHINIRIHRYIITMRKLPKL